MWSAKPRVLAIFILVSIVLLIAALLMYRFLQLLFIGSRFYSVEVVRIVSWYVEMVIFLDMISMIFAQFVLETIWQKSKLFLFRKKSTRSFSNSFISCIMGGGLVDIKPYVFFF